MVNVVAKFSAFVIEAMLVPREPTVMRRKSIRRKACVSYDIA